MLSIEEKKTLYRYFQQAKNHFGFLVVNYDSDTNVIYFDLVKLSDEFIERVMPNGKKYIGQKIELLEKNILTFDATDENISDFFAEFLHKGEPVIFDGDFILHFEDLLAMLDQPNLIEN